MLTHACNPSTWNLGTWGEQVQSQYELHSKYKGELGCIKRQSQHHAHIKKQICEYNVLKADTHHTVDIERSWQRPWGFYRGSDGKLKNNLVTFE